MRALGRVAVVGAGQVGTMVGMALLEMAGDGSFELGFWDLVRGRAERAVQRAGGHRVLSGPSEVVGADTVILAMPVPESITWLRGWGARLSPNSLVIDTGSAKAVVAATMRDEVPVTVHVIGGHPICGNQGSGPEAADPAALKGCHFALTPVRDDPTAELWASGLVRRLGAVPIVLDPGSHDRIVAGSSHLPHVIAAALVSLIPEAGAERELWQQLIGPSFRSATRVVDADPEMVAGFLAVNTTEIRRTALEFAHRLEEVVGLAPRPDRLARLLTTLRQRRREICGERP